MKAIDRRMANIERAAGIGKEGTTVILQWFGSPITGAVAGALSFEKGSDETKEQFEARVQREAPGPDGGGFRIIKLTGKPGGSSDADLL